MPVFSPPAKDKEATLPAPTFSLRGTEPTLPATEPATREKTRARLREQRQSFVVLQAGKRQWVSSRDDEAARLPTRVTRSLVPTTTRTSRLRDKLDPRAGGCVLGLFLAQARTAASAFVDKSSLVDALEEWCTDAADATITYGHISTWDVRAVTELKYLVMDAPCRSTFDEDINAWDVSQVTNMQAPRPLGTVQGLRACRAATRSHQGLGDGYAACACRGATQALFQQAAVFDQPLDAWDVTKVTSLKEMFLGASSFNQPIGLWSVIGQVSDMQSTFREAAVFDQDLNAWETSAVTTMHSLFYQAYAFNQLLNAWKCADRRSNLVGPTDLQNCSLFACALSA